MRLHIYNFHNSFNNLFQKESISLHKSETLCLILAATYFETEKKRYFLHVLIKKRREKRIRTSHINKRK